jgi:hypothetical protein
LVFLPGVLLLAICMRDPCCLMANTLAASLPDALHFRLPNC